jgi:hypothetical protein
VNRHADFLDKQDQIYQSIAARGQGDRVTTRVGGLDLNQPFGSVLIVARLNEGTQAWLARWREQVAGLIGEAFALTTADALHTTLANSLPKVGEVFEPNSEAVQAVTHDFAERLTQFVHGLGTFGRVDYPSRSQVGHPVIMSNDSMILGGRPDASAVHQVDALHEDWPDNAPPWGFHTTLGRWTTVAELDAKALRALNETLGLPPENPVTTLDVAHQINTPEQGYAVQAVERYTLKGGVWRLAD